MQRTQPATAQPGRQNQHDGKRDLLAHLPHPGDGRAIGLYLTPAGNQLMDQAENTATELESDVSSRLTAKISEILMKCK